MKHLIVGAGATLAEAIALGVPPEAWPPVIRDFARKTWADYSPSPVLDAFLKSVGLWEPREDTRVLFFELEAAGKTDIERYMAFAWRRRDAVFDPGPDLPPGFVSGLRVTHAGAPPDPPGGHWEDLLYHGIGRPLADAQMTCFYQDAVGFRPLELSQRVARRFGAGDFILNLNYDTVFEIALQQLGRPFSYAPSRPNAGDLIVCKPHGSLNLVSNARGFKFGQPDLVYFLPPPGFQSFSGLVPPRLEKRYDQHPIAGAILTGAAERRPTGLTFWGIGLTESDHDLLSLYRAWASQARFVDVINPDPAVAATAKDLFPCPVRAYATLDAWDAAGDEDEPM